MSSNKINIIPVILSGGVGSRLWPISRSVFPKPFIKLTDGESLIEKTYKRACALKNVKDLITVTNRDFLFQSKDAFETVGSVAKKTFILEPFGRNSAAAICLAAEYIKSNYDSNAYMLVLSSDHLIKDESAFSIAVEKAVALAQQNKIVTFGIEPTGPEIGFGYIEADGNAVKSFVEKPNKELAQKYIEQGNFYWNSGMFCMQMATFFKEAEKHCQALVEQSKICIDNAEHFENEHTTQLSIQASNFEHVESISIDYALMEKSENVAVVPCDMAWSDVGSWLEFSQQYEMDDSGNRVDASTELINVENCIIKAETGKVVACIGLKDLIIADTEDALFVSHKNSSQDIKQIFNRLKKNNHPASQTFKTVQRPWGTYTVLEDQDFFKAKRIEVKPGECLSLQMHHKRSEHWIVVKGTAHVVNGDDNLVLSENESTYIAKGSKHRLENKSDQVLVLIEVQCGDYFGEDDIVRFEDRYGRV